MTERRPNSGDIPALINTGQTTPNLSLILLVVADLILIAFHALRWWVQRAQPCLRGLISKAVTAKSSNMRSYLGAAIYRLVRLS